MISLARALFAGITSALFLAGSRPSASADPVADFYAHRQVRVMIGVSTGGGYDLYARVLARYMGKHIPGNPLLVPENMPGAGSLRLANYLYAAAPKDGTVIGTINRGLAMEGLLHHSQGLMYDAAKFTWIGSVTDEVSVCGFSKESGIATWQDMLTKSYSVGGTGSGSDNDIYPTVLRNMLGLKMKIVTGYPGSAEIDLAMRRHEVDGRCGWSWSSMMSRDKVAYERGEIVVPVQFALARSPELPNVPVVSEVTDDPKKAAVLKLFVSRQTMARPFLAPPGVPEERAKALRDAFDATMKDPDYLAEMQKLELEVHPVNGATLQKLVDEQANTPKDVLDYASSLLQEKK